MNAERLLAHAGCEVRCDALNRELYATDASHYRLLPQGVAFPRGTDQVVSLIAACVENNISLTPRGAGTGLVGGALGQGMVIDFARRNHDILELNLARQTVRVQAGVVLDQLNEFLRPHGLWFGPDVATSSRATIGGMIANNSSGARTPLYGTTADHILSLEAVLTDGRVVQGNRPDTHEHVTIQALIESHRGEIMRRMPSGLSKRWPGYALDRLLHELTWPNLLSGSEGTLAVITQAELKVVPRPTNTGLGLIFFASVNEAMQATVELLDLQPASMEHLDRMLLDQTRGQSAFQAARDLLELDERPAESVLVLEFFEDVPDRLAELERRQLGLRSRGLCTSHEINLVWSLRKAGLSLLTGCKGAAKPVTCIEDTAVRPSRLPEYYAALQSALDAIEVKACFYGHAAAGLLHVRPVLNLADAADRRKFREISHEVAAIVRQFNGSFAAEHGVGMARTEFMREQVGETLLGVMRSIKQLFDPHHVLNPGKVIGDGEFRIDRWLRSEADAGLTFPGEPTLSFADRDETFLAHLEQCNGCGGCRKATPTMCPTFIATGEESQSPRGRVNAIRAALGQRFGSEMVAAPELAAVLDSCLACKACATECPSNVNLPLLKAELVQVRQHRHSLTWRERLFSHVDAMARVGSVAPDFANALLRSSLARRVLGKGLGLARQRPLPKFAGERFDHWFAARAEPPSAERGRIILWDDCFVRYYEPRVGRAAVRVLEAAGFEVTLLGRRACCGRPAFSQGNLESARTCGLRNAELLSRRARSEGAVPILFLEPSCYSMFAQDYRELRIPGAEEIAARSYLFETFMNAFLREHPRALSFHVPAAPLIIHAHCHSRALAKAGDTVALASHVPGAKAVLLESGCCGMAGAFGALEQNYQLSRQIAEPLLARLLEHPAEAMVIASGTSCRQQIEHLSGRRTMHAAEWMDRSLAGRAQKPV